MSLLLTADILSVVFLENSGCKYPVYEGTPVGRGYKWILQLPSPPSQAECESPLSLLGTWSNLQLLVKAFFLRAWVYTLHMNRCVGLTLGCPQQEKSDCPEEQHLQKIQRYSAWPSVPR
jgi:hypothetical protein